MASCTRLLCTSASSSRSPHEKLRQLRRHVFRLYTHIHPDRLAQYPKHRAINEASFKILQSTLSRYFQPIQPPQPPSTQAHIPHPPQLLTFFAHPPSTTVQSTSQLTKAVVPFHESRIHILLRSLFEKLHLKPPPSHLLPPLPHNFNSTTPIFSSLSQLIAHTRKTFRQPSQPSTHPDSTPDQLESQLIRHALQRTHGFIITVAQDLPTSHRLTLLYRRLSNFLKNSSLPERHAAAIHLELHAGRQVHFNSELVFPYLRLGACATDDAWRTVFESEQMRIACENAHAFQNVLNEWELLSGTKLGVRLIMHDFRPVFCSQHGIALFDQHNTLQLMKRSSDLLKTYKALLHTLAERGVDICRARGVQVSSVAVMIQEGFDVNCDESQGVLRIGIERGVEGIVEAIQTRGGKLNMHYERQMREEQVERKRVLLIKKALRISGLRRMEGVPDWEWKEALGRLRFHASRLAVVLDGVPVAIGSQVSLLKSTGEIELPYNFNEMLDI